MIQASYVIEHWTAILTVLGNIATLIGLGFTIAAWRRARGAEQAAKEAREFVRQDSAAEDFRILAEKAKELLSDVQHQHIEAASLRCRDLVVELS